jgi:hypothetical protein
MTHALALALCLTGFATLALAMRRQQNEIFGRQLRPAHTSRFRAAGAIALLITLGVVVAQRRWSFGLVIFSGHASLAAGVVYCGLIGHWLVTADKARHK